MVQLVVNHLLSSREIRFETCCSDFWSLLMPLVVWELVMMSCVWLMLRTQEVEVSSPQMR